MTVDRLLAGLPISPVSAPPEAVIDCLRAMLARAEKGEVTGIVIVGALATGGTSTGFEIVGEGDLFRLVYGLEVAKLRLLGVQSESPS